MMEDRELRVVAAGGDTQLDDRGIRDAELDRARHALTYFKGKVGNDAIQTLLHDDLRSMAARVRGCVELSQEAWQRG